MKIIVKNGQTYARHWFKWYWVVCGMFYPITTIKEEAEGDEV